MSRNSVARNLQVLGQLLKNIVADRFKHMAKDEIFRFSLGRVDPALLVDLNLQVEREALALTELSLFELVTADRLKAELRRSATRVQQAFQTVYGEDFPLNFLSETLIAFRVDCIAARVDLYNPFLSVEEQVQTALDLAASAFSTPDRLGKKLDRVFRADEEYCDALMKESEQTHRFLVKKQVDYELKKSKELWTEFSDEAFREPKALQ